MNHDTVEIMASDFPIGNQSLIAEALRDQEEIGWPQALRGFLSSKWRMLADQEGGNGQAGKEMHTMKTINIAIFEMSRALWLARNETLHGENSEELTSIRSAEKAEMKALHSNPLDLPAGDRHYCEGSWASLMAKSPSVRRRWLRHMRMAKAKAIKEGAKQLAITEFFARAPKRDG